MTCLCDQFADYLEVHPDDVEAFVARLSLIRDDEGIRLYRCESCHQLWYFDYLSRSNLAVKVLNENAWRQLDAEALRTELHVQQLLDHCGGYGDEKCKWRGRTRQAVKGRAFCPYH